MLCQLISTSCVTEMARTNHCSTDIVLRYRKQDTVLHAAANVTLNKLFYSDGSMEPILTKKYSRILLQIKKKLTPYEAQLWLVINTLLESMKMEKKLRVVACHEMLMGCCTDWIQLSFSRADNEAYSRWGIQHWTIVSISNMFFLLSSPYIGSQSTQFACQMFH